MPLAKIKHIVSFSSEDEVHRAKNLLKENTHGKWKCAKVGERQAVVVLQLDCVSRITGIDIGNDGSAFVEVLVGRSSGDEDYQVLLVASSFMSPHESRSGNGANRVRMFNERQLSSEVAKQQWDRVKVVCTQPFNKHTTYGLSFINLHSKASETVTDEVASGDIERKTFGKFKLRDDDVTKPSAPPTARPSSSHVTVASLASKSPPTKLKVEPQQTKTPKAKSPKEDIAQKLENLKRRKAATGTTSSKTPAKKMKLTTKPAKSFSSILEGVIFTLSGFQNPQRSDIRNEAVSMGAQYRRDWCNECSHLICAFINTPKYRQVAHLSRARIVGADWISDCAAQKTRLPWRPYNMNSNVTSQDSSDEETVEEAVPVTEQATTSSTKDPYDVSTDEDEDNAGDTDDEIEQVKREMEDSKPGPLAPPTDPYDVSTDEEDNGDGQLPALPDHFSNVNFFLYGDFPDGIERLLRRHIVTCNGTIENYMNDQVKFVVTEAKWDENFDDALKSNSSLVFVGSEWVFECGRKRALLPHKPYVVEPS